MRGELVLWGVAAVLVLAELHVVFHGPERAERVLKPLSVASIGVAGIGSGLLDRPWGVVAIAGLALGLVGDVLLLDGVRPSRFLGGLSAFLGGHLLYLAAFVMVGLSASAWLALPVVVCLACLVASRALLPSLWRAGDRPLAGAVATYVLVISTAAVLAAATGRPLVALGAALFVVSDTVLSVDKFLTPVPRAHLWVMATYLLAQTGIVAGLALR